MLTVCAALAGLASPAIAQPAQVQKLLPKGGASEDLFGFNVSVDGDLALVGAPWDDDGGSRAGSAYIFERRQDATWIEAAKLVAHDGDRRDVFGSYLGVSGETALVGAFADDVNGPFSGSAYIFERIDGEWIEVANLVPEDGGSGHEFGSAAAIDGDVIVLGAHHHMDSPTHGGATYIYERIEGEWGLTAIREVVDIATPEKHGFAVSVSGRTIVSAAYSVSDPSYDTGSLYIYDKNDAGTWVESAKLRPEVRDIQDRFAIVCGIHGDVVVAGAPYDSDVVEGSGAAYVFERDKLGDWRQAAKLKAPVPVVGDQFGYAVSVHGDLYAVGSRRGPGRTPHSGAVYLYERAGGNWPLLAKVSADDGEDEDLFGRSVFTDGHMVIAGAMHDDDLGINAGAAYLFSREVVPATEFEVTQGRFGRGGLEEAEFSDDRYLEVFAFPPLEVSSASVEVVFTSNLPTQTPGQLALTAEVSSSGDPALLRIELYNYDRGEWQLFDERDARQGDAGVIVTISDDPTPFMDDGTGEVKARIGFHDRGVTFPSWLGRFDMVHWTVIQ